MTWVLKMLYYPIKIDKNRKQLVYNKRLFNSYFLKKTNRLIEENRVLSIETVLTPKDKGISLRTISDLHLSLRSWNTFPPFRLPITLSSLALGIAAISPGMRCLNYIMSLGFKVSSLPFGRPAGGSLDSSEIGPRPADFPGPWTRSSS